MYMSLSCTGSAWSLLVCQVGCTTCTDVGAREALAALLVENKRLIPTAGLHIVKIILCLCLAKCDRNQMFNKLYCQFCRKPFSLCWSWIYKESPATNLLFGTWSQFSISFSQYSCSIIILMIFILFYCYMYRDTLKSVGLCAILSKNILYVITFKPSTVHR